MACSKLTFPCDLPQIEREVSVVREREAIPHPELDLLPLLKSSVDKLWDRPYDCRVFLMQLLQGLSDLDDQSLCMMCSCFARYLENHSVPIAN